MCPMLRPKVFSFEMRSISVPILRLPLIGGRFSGCLLIFEIVELVIPGKIPAETENCRRLRALGGAVSEDSIVAFSPVGDDV